MVFHESMICKTSNSMGAEGGRGGGGGARGRCGCVGGWGGREMRCAGGRRDKSDTSYTEGVCGGGEGHWGGGGGGRRAKGTLPTQRLGEGGRKGHFLHRDWRKEGKRGTSYTEIGGRREKGALPTRGGPLWGWREKGTFPIQRQVGVGGGGSRGGRKEKGTLPTQTERGVHEG